MATVQVGAQTIGYDLVGAGSPLLVLNGFAATRADWDPGFIEALACNWQLVLLDNRGVGESSGADTDFTIDDLVADTGGAIDALELGSVPVVGWSMGGFIAQQLALTRPESVSSLTLLATTGGGDAFVPGSDQTARKLRDLSGTPREQATRLISLLFTPERATEIDSQFGDIVADARAALDLDVVGRQIELIDRWQQRGAALGEIDKPVLVAAGSEDVVFPVENAVRIATAIPDAWLARFPGAGHALMADRPQQLARLIDSFLIRN